MSGIGLFLIVLLGSAPARAVETAAPAAGAVRAIALPAFSTWLRGEQGLRLVAGVDPNLALLATVPVDAQVKALDALKEGLSPQTAARLELWSSLAAPDRAALLTALSQARADAASEAVADLKRRASAAGPAELETLAREAAGYAIFGEEARAALAEIGERVYAARLAAREEELRSFVSRKAGDEPPSGAQSAGPARLAKSLPELAHERSAPPPPAKKPDLKVRAATAALLVPSIIGVIHLGGAAFLVFTVTLAALSMGEFTGMLSKGKRPIQPFIAMLGGAGLALGVALHAPAALTVGALVLLAAARELLRPDHSLERAANTVFGALLFGFLPAHLALVRGFAPFGERVALMLFASAWASDTTAYFFGRRWGSHKIAPKISPNKTWEGAAAGFVGASLAVAAFWLTAPAMMPWWAALGIALVMGVVGQASGYLNSMIKRANGVKDSGNLLPGHGGVIDRFDTFVLAAPLVYLLLSLI